jgi:hypothetical protein
MNKNNSSSGLGLSSVLTIIFVVLKLVGTIDWSWWWVLSPTLISIGLWVVLIICIAIWEFRWDRKYKYGFTKKGKKDKWKF